MRSTRALAYGLGALVGGVSAAVLALMPSMPIMVLVLPVMLVAYRLRLGPALVTAASSTITAIALDDTPLRGAVLFVVAGIVGASVDAFQRARARERAAMQSHRASHERFVQFFHASPVAMAVSSTRDHRVIEVNAAYLALFGIRRDDIIGRTSRDATIVMPDGVRDPSFVALRRSVSAELDVTTPAGRKRLILWSRVIELAAESCALSTFVDVTEQYAAREAARASDQRFQELAENLEEVFWLSDPSSETMLYMSPAYEKVFGRSCAALYADGRDWIAAVHPDDRERTIASLVARDEPWEGEFRFVRTDAAIRTFRFKIQPIRKDGKTVRVAGVGEDVTDQLVLEAQLRQTQKLESLGLLAGGVAHDFNNILAVIGANASLLASVGQAEDRELVNEIEDAVVRATSLTRQLLAFSRKQVIEPIVLDLNATVNDTRRMLRRMLGEDVSITTSLDPELGHIRIDPGYLVQLIMNLAVNARDAMPLGGTLEITTRNSVHEGACEVMLAIADTGCGMPAEVAGRIFEPFFTTKEVGRGTGLGLSVVHGIVEQAGGRIEVQSAVNEGTTIRICLPFVDAPAERISDLASAGAAGTEKILVVDDDMFVRRATSRALRARGYHVLEASDAGAALRLLRDHPDIDLLVTDVVMPGADGRALAEAAREHKPGLRVIFVSGYMDDAMLRHGIKAADVPFIEKPFAGHALAGRVRQILDAA